MSCATTWTPADVAALEAAIKDGVQSVEYNGKKVNYRSLAEMRELLALMKSEVCGDSSNGLGRFGKVYMKHSKGLC